MKTNKHAPDITPTLSLPIVTLDECKALISRADILRVF